MHRDSFTSGVALKSFRRFQWPRGTPAGLTNEKSTGSLVGASPVSGVLGNVVEQLPGADREQRQRFACPSVHDVPRTATVRTTIATRLLECAASVLD
jgi:hypothetical protein